MSVNRIAILHTGFSENDLDAAKRIAIATRRLNIETEIVSESTEVGAFAPDFVLALSHQDAKLTPFPTYGIVDTPFTQLDVVPRFVRNVLTYDACLTSSSRQRQWILDVSFGAHKQQPRVGLFMRTAQSTAFETHISSDAMLACRIGGRSPSAFNDVLVRLSRTRLVKAYGSGSRPPAGFDSQAYFGDVPADGLAMINRFQVAGVGLALSEAERLEHGLPPEELFQVVAGGAIAICSRSSWVEDAFGDSVLYVDAEQGPRALAAEILEQIAWVRDHPEAAREKASQAHSILQQHYTVERLLPNILDLHEKVLVEKGYVPDPQQSESPLPSVSYIMRTGGGGARPSTLIRRALDSLVRQDYRNLTVIFVLHAAYPGLDEMMAQEFPALSYKVVQAIGSMRSTAIVAGIEAVETDLFGLLDDDDEFHPNHVRMLVRTLAYHDRRDLRGPIGVAYASSVNVFAEGFCKERPEWSDDYALERKQRSCIEHYRWYTTGAMASHTFFLMSNSWLARRELLNADVLDDPFLDTCEDLYLAVQLAQRSHFAFSCEVTAIHHFHGHGQSTFLDSGKHWFDTERMARRAWRRTFPAQITYFDPDHVRKAVPLGVNLLPRMSCQEEGVFHDEVLTIDRRAVTGTAVWGPYIRFPAGRYQITWILEHEALNANAATALRFDVVHDSGNVRLAEKAVGSVELSRGGLQRFTLPFEVTREAARDGLEFRLWRETEMMVEVMRVAVTRDSGSSGAAGRRPTADQHGSEDSPWSNPGGGGRGALSIEIDLMPIMSIQEGALQVGNARIFGRSLETGIAAWGPYRCLPAGSYQAIWAVELDEVSRFARKGLRFDVVSDNGDGVIAKLLVPGAHLRQGRQGSTRVEFELPFIIPGNLEQKPLEFRVWRETGITFKILQLMVVPQ